MIASGLEINERRLVLLLVLLGGELAGLYQLLSDGVVCDDNGIGRYETEAQPLTYRENLL